MATLQNSKKVLVIESFKQESMYIVWIICPPGQKDGRCRKVPVSEGSIDKYIYNCEPILGAANMGLALFFSITSLKK